MYRKATVMVLLTCCNRLNEISSRKFFQGKTNSRENAGVKEEFRE
jgi:hypothetical protein